ncbi:MAG: hypothetical protein DRI57_13390 [Deltaproteobacteria bacterium]|nr:MAG: hypothetical protein DRI57_13390 [Deltaproteobacteria bacterium]
MVKNLYALKKDFGKRGIFLSFSGPLSQELMVEIGATLKQKMKLEEASKSTVFRVFSMVVENAQNIIYYSAEESHGIIIVGYENKHYFVMSGNMLKNEKVERLRKKLTALQTMDKDELKKHYKVQRKKGPGEGSKGGGLGFIEMARKASRPIEFEFEKIDGNVSFFSVKIVI